MTLQTLDPEAGRRAPVAVIGGLVGGLLLVVSGVLLLGTAGSRAVLAVDDLSQVVAAVFAAAMTGWCALRSPGPSRRSWAALSAGCASWALGQGIWSYYELALGQETPFPSLADVGFLGFPVGAIVALVLYPAGGARGDSRRRALDGLTVTTALGLLSWVTALGAVVKAESTSLLTDAVSIAYPATDLVVLTMVVLLLSHGTADRRALGLIGGGLSLIALSDSAFLYLTAAGSYSAESHAVSLGWCGGFALLGLAPLVSRSSDTALDDGRNALAGRASTLPYVPLALAAVVVGVQLLSGGRPDLVEGLLLGLALLTVLLRQYATVRDNSRLLGELAAREAELRHQAFHDGLTGLANRALFRDRVAHALDLHRRDRRPLSVLFCDLDDFKVINDTQGHAGGDALLVRVADRLRGALRSGDTLARLGGDEFAVLLEDGSEPLGVAQKVVEALREPFALPEAVVHVQVSVGITSVVADATTPSADALLAQADTAMYAAKRSGKDAARAFVVGMELAEVADSELAVALREAVRDREITVVYQPIVALPSGHVTGIEALARWTRDGVPVPPATFIPVAERTGVIGPLTALVLDTVVAQIAAWAPQLEGSVVRVGLNLSPESVVDRALPDQVLSSLARHGVIGHRLALEVTESGLLSDPAAAAEVCGALRAQGVHLALDDFGVGYSSLAHLHALPLDSLKVDRAFVELVDRDADQRRFTRAVLRLGDDLGLDVIAEGVERPQQLAELLELGCTYAQGYLFSRPVPAAEVPALLGRSLLPPELPVQAGRRPVAVVAS